jgi:hypothetical protein
LTPLPRDARLHCTFTSAPAPMKLCSLGICEQVDTTSVCT